MTNPELTTQYLHDAFVSNGVDFDDYFASQLTSRLPLDIFLGEPLSEIHEHVANGRGGLPFAIGQAVPHAELGIGNDPRALVIADIINAQLDPAQIIDLQHFESMFRETYVCSASEGFFIQSARALESVAKTGDTSMIVNPIRLIYGVDGKPLIYQKTQELDVGINLRPLILNGILCPPGSILNLFMGPATKPMGLVDGIESEKSSAIETISFARMASFAIRQPEVNPAGLTVPKIEKLAVAALSAVNKKRARNLSR